MALPFENLTPEQQANVRDYIGFSRGKNVYDMAADPTANDDTADGFDTGSIWVNITGGKIFCCMTAAAGAASWIKLADLVPAESPTSGIQPSDEGFSVVDPTGGEVKSLNPNTATIGELLDFVATLTKSLKSKSVI